MLQRGRRHRLRPALRLPAPQGAPPCCAALGHRPSGALYVRLGGRSTQAPDIRARPQDVVWERMDSVQNNTTFLRADMAPFAAPPERALADRAAAAAALAQAAFASVVPTRHGAPGAPVRHWSPNVARRGAAGAPAHLSGSACRCHGSAH